MSKLLFIFLQTNPPMDTLQTSASTHAPQSVLDIILSSGPIGVGIILILLALSVFSFYVFFERYFSISKSEKFDPNLLNNVKMALQSGNVQGAKGLLMTVDSPVARVLSKGISRLGQPSETIEKDMENVAKVELFQMEKGLGFLSLVAKLSPMFGFVGTIMGVIKIFYDISLTDNISIGVIAGGLYQKMFTSAAGLIVGVLAFVGFYIVNTKIDKVVNKIEVASLDFLDFLQEPGK